MGHITRIALAGTIAVGAWFAVPAPTAAQISGEGYMLHEPAASLTLRGGFARPSADSQLFGFVTDLLTVDRGDFTSFSVGGEIGFWVGSRVMLGVSGDYASRSTDSEYRDWVDQDDLPIVQSTRFSRAPFLATARFYLVPRGRSVGNYAWIPATWAPYLGAGGGAVWYQFHQSGDFVDFVDNSVYASEIESSDWAAAARVMAGVEYSVSPIFTITGETSYTHADADLNNFFEDFDSIDLSGFAATVGVSARL